MPRPIFISSTNKVIEDRDQWQTLVLASIVNHSGGNLDDVSSTARNSRTTARKEAAYYIKNTFSFLNVDRSTLIGSCCRNLEGQRK